MLVIAFWNIHKSHNAIMHVSNLITTICSRAGRPGGRTEVLFCLAEPGDVTPAELASRLNEGISVESGWWTAYSEKRRFICISNIPQSHVEMRVEREVGWPLMLTRQRDGVLASYNVFFVHLASPLGRFQPDVVGINEGAALRDACKDLESGTVIDTIVIGDFNMDPYAKAMVDPKTLNAVMCRELALRNPIRTFQKNGFEEKQYRVFYNPMWNLLGDQVMSDLATETNQPGSFYVSGDNSDCAIWHAIDQVLLRPSLIPYFQAGSAKIMTHTGKTSLLTRNGIINSSISDHLPVSIELNI